MTFTHGFADNNGLRMYYEVHGEAVPGQPPPHRRELRRGYPRRAGPAQGGLDRRAGIQRRRPYRPRAGTCVPAVVRCLIAASTFASRDAVPDEFWDRMASATLDDEPATYQDEDRRLNPEPGHLERQFELDSRRILDFPGWSDKELGTIAARTLVVAGDRDIVTAAYAERLAGLIPGARLLIVPAGHGDYLGERDASRGDLRTMHATVPLLLRFLGGVAGRRRARAASTGAAGSPRPRGQDPAAQG